MKITIEIKAQKRMHENILAHSIQSIYVQRYIQETLRWTLTRNTPIEPTLLTIQIAAIELEKADA